MLRQKKVKVSWFFCHGIEGDAGIVIPLHDNELLEDWWIEWSWKIFAKHSASPTHFCQKVTIASTMTIGLLANIYRC